MLTPVDCKLVFVASTIGHRTLEDHVNRLLHLHKPESLFARLVIIGDLIGDPKNKIKLQSYQDFLASSESSVVEGILREAETQVLPSDVLNLQFTSGKRASLVLNSSSRLIILIRNYGYAESSLLDTHVRTATDDPLLLKSLTFLV